MTALTAEALALQRWHSGMGGRATEEDYKIAALLNSEVCHRLVSLLRHYRNGKHCCPRRASAPDTRVLIASSSNHPRKSAGRISGSTFTLVRPVSLFASHADPPDGGVARLRVYGTAQPSLLALRPGQTIDLAAVENGGLAVSWSDCHFGLFLWYYYNNC
jgi:hypothetical protein